MRTMTEMAREAVNGRIAKTLEETQSLINLEEVKRFEVLVRADEREEFNRERQQYADWLDEAAADIEDWGMYAPESLQQKWDLPDQVQDYKNRAASIRLKGNT